MVLVAYRHGFRASELVDLRWDQIDFDTANLSVRRAKEGSPSTHRSGATSCAHCGSCNGPSNDFVPYAVPLMSFRRRLPFFKPEDSQRWFCRASDRS